MTPRSSSDTLPPAPTHPSNQNVIRQCLRWGFQEVRRKGDKVILRSPRGVLVDLEPERSHQGNSAEVLQLIPSLVNVSRVEFWAKGEPDEAPEPEPVKETPPGSLRGARPRVIGHPGAGERPPSPESVIYAKPEEPEPVPEAPPAPAPQPEPVKETVAEAVVGPEEAADIARRMRALADAQRHHKQGVRGQSVEVLTLLVLTGENAHTHTIANDLGVTIQQVRNATWHLHNRNYLIDKTAPSTYRVKPELREALADALGLNLSTIEEPEAAAQPVAPEPVPETIEEPEPVTPEDPVPTPKPVPSQRDQEQRAAIQKRAEELAAEAPPLSDEQRSRIATIAGLPQPEPTVDRATVEEQVDTLLALLFPDAIPTRLFRRVSEWRAATEELIREAGL